MERKETVARVQGSAAALAERVRDAKLDERAAELAALARTKVRQAELDAKAAELAGTVRQLAHEAGVDELVGRVRDSAVAHQATEAAAQVSKSAHEVADRTLDRVGEWIGDGEVGKRMGLRRRRRLRPWTIVLGAAVAAGVAAGVAYMRRSQEESDDSIWGAGDIDTPTGEQRSTAPGVALPLEARVREALGQDPRTASLPRLNVNVVDGTVFVRGSVPAGVDEQALRAVIEGVDGVTDVDLQVAAGA